MDSSTLDLVASEAEGPRRSLRYIRKIFSENKIEETSSWIACKRVGPHVRSNPAGVALMAWSSDSGNARTSVS